MNTAWPPAKAPSRLEAGEAHVWLVSLVLSPTALQAARCLLDQEELARADRYIPEHARRNFTASRAALRSLLGLYSGLEPRTVRFAHNEYGKPEVANCPGGQCLRFNLSHSGDWALIGVVLDVSIGVDIEQVRRISNMSFLAETWFSAVEFETFRTQPESSQMTAFFNGWTRKEAFIKAIGKGLAHPLKSFDVELSPSRAATLLRAEGMDAFGWSLSDLPAPAGYKAALVVESPAVAVMRRRYELERELAAVRPV